MTYPFILSILTSYVMALLAMAFYTLLERKALGYFQLRKGPNKVGFAGIPQPFADAIKLFAKEQSTPAMSNLAPFLLAPVASLILALLLWTILPMTTPAFFIKLGALTFLCISSLNIYTTLAAGWTSNSKYALLGAIRSIAQTISYEVSMALILLSALCALITLNLTQAHATHSVAPALMFAPLFFCWFITTLAETNRTPFDLAEGESELVSGFNIEYSAGNFALIFMAEYTSIIIMCLITTAIWLPMPFIFVSLLDVIFTIKAMILAFLFVWLRATLPRMRYDQLMSLTWKSFLPFSLIMLVGAPSINLFI